MYLLLILLISPAFGRPSSDQPNVGAEIGNYLNNILLFSNETVNILLNSTLTEEVSKMLLEFCSWAKVILTHSISYSFDRFKKL